MNLGEQLFHQNKNRGSGVAIITHRNCPDGSAAAVIAKKMDPSIFWFPATHHKINEQLIKTSNNLQNGGKLYVVDIACNEKTLLKVLPILRSKNVSLGIYDHHESNLWLENFVSEILPQHLPEDTSDLLEIVFDKNRCGSKIFFDRNIGDYPELEEYRDFIEINNDRDLWLLQDERSEKLARFHEILQDDGYVERFLKKSQVEFDEKETYLLEYSKMNEDLKHERLLRNLHIKQDQENYKYGVIYGEADSSNLLNKAIERFDLEYAILINLNTKKGSIRGRGNKDCSFYAEQFGGGGHRCASGFQFQFEEPKF